MLGLRSPLGRWGTRFLGLLGSEGTGWREGTDRLDPRVGAAAIGEEAPSEDGVMHFARLPPISAGGG